MAKIGYARVSTEAQILSEQLAALEKFGCTKIFSGKFSGKPYYESDYEYAEAVIATGKQNKAQLEKMLNYIREGDVVVVTRVDRLGRSLSQIMKVFDVFRKKNVEFIALEQGIDTTKRSDPMAMAMIYLLGLFAELERSFIVERTQEGKRAKIAAGDLKAKGGRPKILSEEAEKRLLKDIKKNYSLTNLAKKYEVSRATISRYKKQIK